VNHPAASLIPGYSDACCAHTTESDISRGARPIASKETFIAWNRSSLSFLNSFVFNELSNHPHGYIPLARKVPENERS
jgi:hypothetical protein